MEKLLIEPTKVTPTITFSPEDGCLEIKGRSMPENPMSFYEPISQIIEATAGMQDLRKITANFMLEYFNTSSSRCIIGLFRKLELVSTAKDVEINWYYEEEDEDMFEMGEDMAEMISIPVNLRTLNY